MRRILAKHGRPTSGAGGLSWLSFRGHAKDSLWSVELFRCESLVLRTHWVMVVMDQFTRRIIGFAVQPGAVDGSPLCRMFHRVIAGALTLTQQLSSDHDPLLKFYRWKANLRILDVTEVKTVPHVPLSHPFVERMIGTVRRERLDHIPFWGTRDLERKLRHFRDYYNHDRVHASLNGATPVCSTDRHVISLARKVAFHFMAQRSVPWTVVVFDEAKDAKSFWEDMFTEPQLRPSRQVIDPHGRAVTVHVALLRGGRASLDSFLSACATDGLWCRLLKHM